jgi:hypothetical protein
MYKTCAAAAVVALSCSAPAEPGKTQIMYYNPTLEIKLSKEYHERRLAWPVLRVGIIDGGKHRFAMVRILIKEGAGRSELAREIVACGRLAFKLVPSLEQVDVDAVLEDDTRRTKAQPLFAVSLHSQQIASFNPRITPEKWLVGLGALTISPKLRADRDPIQTASDTMWDFYHDAYNRVPITRNPPKGDPKAKTRKTQSESGNEESGKHPTQPAQPP